MKNHLEFNSSLRQLEQHEEEFISLFQHGSLEVELYKPIGIDKQSPHDRDEIYVIASGTSDFILADERTRCQVRDVLFVPAGQVHRFEHFSADFSTWVFFYGPKGGEEGHGAD